MSDTSRIEVQDPEPYNGLRADHPRLIEYIKNALKLGWGNEQICRVVGARPELVTKCRHEYEKEKAAAKP